MLHRNLMMVGILAIAGLQLSACKHVAAAKTEPEHPAQVKRVEGTEFSSVTLTEKAVQRLGLKTDQVRDREGGPAARSQNRSGSRGEGDTEKPAGRRAEGRTLLGVDL